MYEYCTITTTGQSTIRVGLAVTHVIDVLYSTERRYERTSQHSQSPFSSSVSSPHLEHSKMQWRSLITPPKHHVSSSSLRFATSILRIIAVFDAPGLCRE
jgi:hypothetical protein